MEAKMRPEEARFNIEFGQSKWPDRRQGGWVTFPFVAGNFVFMMVAMGGATMNLIVYLIQKFGMKSIDATQISNIVNGCVNLTPVVGAIIADSYCGCFSIIAVASFISFLGMMLFTLTASLPSLHPHQCPNASTAACSGGPSTSQIAVLYSALALMVIGGGGSRFTNATLGANQFSTAQDQDVFFNWYFIAFYVSSIIGSIVIVYIEDNVGWGLGLGICAAANAIAVVVFVMGRRFYRVTKVSGSPFTGLAQVVVASMVKWGMNEEGAEYYHGSKLDGRGPPSRSFRFLNCAAIKVEGDTHSDGTVAKPWRLATVEQVEDLKALIKIFPLWSSSPLLSITIGIQLSMTVLQALKMDRHIGGTFSAPPGTVPLISMASVALTLPLLDRVVYPAFQRHMGRAPSPLQRLGVGHILNFTGLAGSALVERARLRSITAHGPGPAHLTSVLWLLPPLAVIGAAEALHFPAQVGLYYQEFPEALRGTSTAMIALLIAIGFYLSTAVVGLVRRTTGWLPDDIDTGRVDKVYWMLAVVGAINFCYYVVCARLYKYQKKNKEEVVGSEASDTLST
ncbi:Nitrate excretion transporter 1 [Acorus gramineus]|uniref:Nitrate excretion transporter 1 n=1 Tax=Acorus gramineus TaxID=55184 RepID=A0AAV9AMZ1_ACOGR|nr:Nitrate excretion transporter 1 [Acorus gramineus]